MSSTGARLAPVRATSLSSRARTTLAELLHALNQPLTGLQCSLELAGAVPLQAGQFIRTLNEALDLVSRMRVLVEAIRELADMQTAVTEENSIFELEPIVDATIEDLEPVAESRNIRFNLITASAVWVRASSSGRLSNLLFRFLDSALSLAEAGSEIQIATEMEADQACITIQWRQGEAPEFSPFSRQELSLVIAQAGWEQAGGGCRRVREQNNQLCSLRVPLASEAAHHDSHAVKPFGGRK
jgi:signal transduction histidine kinase